MDDHALHSDEPHTLAALYALGVLDDAAMAVLTAALQADTSLAQEIQSFTRVVQLLGYSAPPVTPPEHLRARLLNAAKILPTGKPAAPTPRPDDASQPFMLHANEGAWTTGLVPGMWIKTLFLDTVRRYTTQLIRLAPGTQVPRHWHAEAEECYLIEGTFHVDAHTFRAGDYIRMPAGSRHNIITSDTGCLLLVTASLEEMPTP